MATPPFIDHCLVNAFSFGRCISMILPFSCLTRFAYVSELYFLGICLFTPCLVVIRRVHDAQNVSVFSIKQYNALYGYYVIPFHFLGMSG